MTLESFLYQKIFSYYTYMDTEVPILIVMKLAADRQTDILRQSDSLLTNSGPYVKREKNKLTLKHTYLYDTYTQILRQISRNKKHVDVSM